MCVCVCVCSPTLLATSGHSCRCGSGLVATESSVWLAGKPQRNVPSSAGWRRGWWGPSYSAQALPPPSHPQWVPEAVFWQEGRSRALAFSRPGPCLGDTHSVWVPRRDPGPLTAQGVEVSLSSALHPLPAPCPLPVRVHDGGLGRELCSPGQETLVATRMLGSFLLQAQAGVGCLATGRSSQLAVASLGWSEKSEGFLWRKKWRRNKVGWPCLSHFLLSRPWVACLPLPAGVGRLCGVWAGLGAPCWCAVGPVALATTGQW